MAAVTVWSRQGQEMAHVKNPGLGIPSRDANRLRDTNREHIRQALAGQEITTVQELDNGDMIQAVVPVRGGEGAGGRDGRGDPRARSGSRRGCAASARPSRSTSSSSS